MKMVSLKNEVDHKPVAEDFVILDVLTPACPDDGVLVQTVHLSLDPYIGSVIRGRHFAGQPPVPQKESIPGAIVGQILESNASGFEKGEWVHSMEGSWQEVCAIKSDKIRKINPDTAPIDAYIGVLGMPGLTAWAGITRLARVETGDVVLIDAAAGAVGGTAGQIAKIQGARHVIGIAGGEEKCKLVTDVYGFDGCVDYKAEDWREKLSKALPGGLTVFFENVSVEMAAIALSHANPYARGVLCGMVDSYHSETQSLHPLNAATIIGKRANLQGLVVYDFYPRWDSFIRTAAEWIAKSQLVYENDEVSGLENAPNHFERLMKGENIGKSVVTLS